MDKRLESIQNNYEKMRIGVDEPFRFHCTQCGDCCINREDILLNPNDLYNMSKELGIPVKETLMRYCEMYIGGGSRIPIVRLRPIGEDRRCPMLKDRKCAIHKAKPGVCAMFPIGRCVPYSMDDGADAEGSQPKMEYTLTDEVRLPEGHALRGTLEYIFTNPGCGDDSETHTVREWLKTFGIPPEDSFFILWTQLVYFVSTGCIKLEKATDSDQMQTIWEVVFHFMYAAYDTHRDFLDQFHENAGDVRRFLEECMECLESDELGTKHADKQQGE